MKKIWKLSIIAILLIAINGCKSDVVDCCITIDAFFANSYIKINSSAKGETVSIPKIIDQYIDGYDMTVGVYDGDINRIDYYNEGKPIEVAELDWVKIDFNTKSVDIHIQENTTNKKRFAFIELVGPKYREEAPFTMSSIKIEQEAAE